MRTIFGPVPSRRFGRSLGIDVVPRKLCTLDCVYCEVGRTDKRSITRKEYLPAEAILREVDIALRHHDDLDCITFSGSGEPTLNAELGRLIRDVKAMSGLTIVVLTNGTLLWREDVRADLAAADIVCPSLDAVTEDVFHRVDRPHPRLSAAQIIEGLITFRNEFKGAYWLEILFVHGMNDHDEEVLLLRDAVDRIRPDKVHINTVVRPPAEPWAKPVPRERLERIRELLGPTAEIIAPSTDRSHRDGFIPAGEEVLALLNRRSMTAREIAEGLGADPVIIAHEVASLCDRGLVHEREFGGILYYEVTLSGVGPAAEHQDPKARRS